MLEQELAIQSRMDDLLLDSHRPLDCGNFMEAISQAVKDPEFLLNIYSATIKKDPAIFDLFLNASWDYWAALARKKAEEIYD